MPCIILFFRVASNQKGFWQANSIRGMTIWASLINKSEQMPTFLCAEAHWCEPIRQYTEIFNVLIRRFNELTAPPSTD